MFVILAKPSITDTTLAETGIVHSAKILKRNNGFKIGRNR
jgi:hypothetical protein